MFDLNAMGDALPLPNEPVDGSQGQDVELLQNFARLTAAQAITNEVLAVATGAVDGTELPGQDSDKFAEACVTELLGVLVKARKLGAQVDLNERLAAVFGGNLPQS